MIVNTETVGSMPVSEDTSEKIFSLPMHPYLEREEQGKVIETMPAVE